MHETPMATPMKNNNTSRKQILMVVAAIMLVAWPLGYSIVVYAAGSEHADSSTFLEMPDAQYTDCVRDTVYMRTHHMDLLKELRDAGVRGGARRKLSISDCTRCHNSRARFCDRCHHAVNLTPDCFECHYYPD